MSRTRNLNHLITQCNEININFITNPDDRKLFRAMLKHYDSKTFENDQNFIFENNRRITDLLHAIYLISQNFTNVLRNNPKFIDFDRVFLCLEKSILKPYRFFKILPNNELNSFIVVERNQYINVFYDAEAQNRHFMQIEGSHYDKENVKPPNILE